MSLQLVQYIIIRKDLQTALNWPVGALIAQACHASTSVLHMNKDDEHTQTYLNQMDSMHKVVLGAPDSDSLFALTSKLDGKNIKYKLWVEQPENIPTCIALKPYPRAEVKSLLQQFKLFT